MIVLPLVTDPIGFENEEELIKWFSEYKKEAISICEKYNSMELWENATFLIDGTDNYLYLISFGNYSPQTQAEQAVEEMIYAFDEQYIRIKRMKSPDIHLKRMKSRANIQSKTNQP